MIDVNTLTFIISCVGSVILISAWLLLLHPYSGYEKYITKWADEHGYKVLRSKRKYIPFTRGPYWWTPKAQGVYFVVLLDEKGNRRNCWIRAGGWFLGSLNPQIDVKWEDS